MSDQGHATVEPVYGDVGEYGTWTVSYTAGDSGLATGARIRVELPNSWNTGLRNGAKGVQSQDPRVANYVSASTGAAATLSCYVEEGSTSDVVKENRTGLDGIRNRYVWVVGIEVLSGSIGSGETVSVVFGDTSGGSPGFMAGDHPQGVEPLAIEVQSGQDADPILLAGEALPSLELIHGKPVEILAVAPSTIKVGEEGELRVCFVDRFGNQATLYEGRVDIYVTTGEVEVPPRWVKVEEGRCAIPFTPNSEGVVRIHVRSTSDLTALSNPVEVSAHEPLVRLYWGDLHSHAELSFDGMGDSPGEYARDVTALDFFARTEHCETWESDEFERLKTAARELHEPGRFVTLLAYEATFGEPWGHHNVFFRGDEGPVSGAHTGTLKDLWALLDRGEAFTIPHHTGIRFDPIAPGNVPGSMGPNPDWKHHDAELRPLIEIYSLHGQCEVYDLTHPLAYEVCNLSMSSSTDGPFYVRDAWAAGLQLGVVSSSDNHRAQPGRGEGGLAAVWSPQLSREGIFDSLLARQSFGTSGARMILHFSVDGSGPGEVIRSSDQHSVAIRVHGTGEIAVVELFGANLETGEYQIKAAWEPGTLDFEETWVDEDPAENGLYYVRVRQADKYRGRAVMAWSSPVWVSADDDAS